MIGNVQIGQGYRTYEWCTKIEREKYEQINKLEKRCITKWNLPVL